MQAQTNKTGMEHICGSPTPRSNMTLTPHPHRDELIMFGGELLVGSKTTMFKDLLMYNIQKNEWTKIETAHAPPARSAHQACAAKLCGGQLWIFGGEFAAKSQFHHYKDLWVFHLSEKRWENVKVPGGPSSRSGHRMVVYDRHLIVFGGFNDNGKSYTYYNDVYAFSLNDYTWTQLQVRGTGPSPRSACQIGVTDKGVVVYGGYSREKLTKDGDEGKTHSDMFLLSPQSSSNASVPAMDWCWTKMRQSGDVPSPRVSMSWVQTPANRAVAFGGVHDETQSEETLDGRFFNDLCMVDLEKGHWYGDILRTKKLTQDRKRRRGGGNKSESTETENETLAKDSDSSEVMSKRLRLSTNLDSDAAVNSPGVVIQQSTSADIMPVHKVITEVSAEEMDVDAYAPSPRMNATLAVKNGILYLFGGIIERGDRQLTLADFYSLDLQKLTSWSVIVTQEVTAKAEATSDSSSDSDDTDSDDQSDDASGVSFDDAEKPLPDDDVDVYLQRTREYWLRKAQLCSDSENLQLSSRNLKKLSTSLGSQFFKKQSDA